MYMLCCCCGTQSHAIASIAIGTPGPVRLCVHEHLAWLAKGTWPYGSGPQIPSVMWMAMRYSIAADGARLCWHGFLEEIGSG